MAELRLRGRVPVALCLLACACLPAVARAGTITVTNTNNAGPGSLRQAIAASAPGETIVVPAGVYSLQEEELRIEKSLTIEGAGAATTILRAGEPLRVLFVAGKTTVAEVSGVTIEEGLTEEASGVAKGGGVFDHEATLTLANDVISGNRLVVDGASGKPGGVAFGGGIDNEAGTLHLIGDTITANLASANGGSGGAGGVVEGGGVYSEGVLTISVTTIASNSAVARGGSGASGGIAKGGGVLITDSREPGVQLGSVELDGNLADASGGPAGGLGGIAEGGGLFLDVVESAGAVSGLSAVGDRALASGNEANGGIARGGGAYLETEGALTVVNSTFSGNTAGSLGIGGQSEGGGVSANAGSAALSLTSDTLSSNAAEGQEGSGGDLSAEGPVQARDTIVSAGSGSAGHENCGGPPGSLGQNIDSRDQCGFHHAGDRVVTDPLLGAVHDNGGGLLTMAPSPGSPAIDAGVGCPAIDERGVARPQGAACDVGAYELAPPVASTLAASAVTQTGAVLHAGVANPDVLAGSLLFEYGPSSSYGQRTAAQALGAVLASTPFSVAVGGLKPGTLYHFRVVAGDPDGSGRGADATFRTLEAAPVLSHLKIHPARFRARRGKGASIAPRGSAAVATLTYLDTEAAKATFAVLEARRGFRSGSRCSAHRPHGHRHAHRCTRLVSVGSFTNADAAGANLVRFTGRVGHRPLAPGSYRLRAIARNAEGLASHPLTIAFQVL